MVLPLLRQRPEAHPPFLGWRVVTGSFVLAVFGGGLGFYGPPIYLATVVGTRGWPIALVSGAVTLHFLVGAAVVANLPRLYRRFGLSIITRAGAVALALGLGGWALAASPWQLLGAALFTGAGWVTMGAAAISAVVSPWFVRGRPKALSNAYNGASVGGIVFSPLWVLLIGTRGYSFAALLVGTVLVVAVWAVTAAGLWSAPTELGQAPDGDVIFGAGGAAAAISTTAPPGDQPAHYRRRFGATGASSPRLWAWRSDALPRSVVSRTSSRLSYPSWARDGPGWSWISPLSGRRRQPSIPSAQ